MSLRLLEDLLFISYTCCADSDGVQGYWFKTIDCLHIPIVNKLQTYIYKGMCLDGRNVMIQENPAKGAEYSYYRPIAFSPLM